MASPASLVAPPAADASDPGILLLTPSEAARRLSVSRSKLWKMHSAGALPAPVYLGIRAPRWDAAELEEWVRAGCPIRDRWEALRDAQGGRTARSGR